MILIQIVGDMYIGFFHSGWSGESILIFNAISLI